MKALLADHPAPATGAASRPHGAAGWIANPQALTTPWPDGATPLYVRVADPDAEGIDDALALAAGFGAAGVLLSRLERASDVGRLAARLAVAEAKAGLADGALSIAVQVSSAAGLFALPALVAKGSRLSAL
ncbi:hypothetical protein ACFQ4O_17475, partial [Methylopila musalis]